MQFLVCGSSGATRWLVAVCAGCVRAWPVLAATCLLAACAVPASPAPQPLGFEVPASWSGAWPGEDTGVVEAAMANTQPSNLAHWWLRFDDPMLTRLVNQALVANTSVVGAQATLRQAQALRDVAAAALSPTLGVAATAQRSEAGSGGSSTGGNTISTAFNAAWLPDLSGGLRMGLAAADATALASVATLADVQVAVAGEVAFV